MPLLCLLLCIPVKPVNAANCSQMFWTDSRRHIEERNRSSWFRLHNSTVKRSNKKHIFRRQYRGHFLHQEWPRKALNRRFQMSSCRFSDMLGLFTVRFVVSSSLNLKWVNLFNIHLHLLYY